MWHNTNIKKLLSKETKVAKYVVQTSFLQISKLCNTLCIIANDTLKPKVLWPSLKNYDKCLPTMLLKNIYSIYLNIPDCLQTGFILLTIDAIFTGVCLKKYI